ncbi:MAG: hypothetical protein AABY75_05530 [Bacteroidota bacterium]
MREAYDIFKRIRARLDTHQQRKAAAHLRAMAAFWRREGNANYAAELEAAARRMEGGASR